MRAMPLAPAELALELPGLKASPRRQDTRERLCLGQPLRAKPEHLWLSSAGCVILHEREHTDQPGRNCSQGQGLELCQHCCATLCSDESAARGSFRLVHL